MCPDVTVSSNDLWQLELQEKRSRATWNFYIIPNARFALLLQGWKNRDSFDPG